MSYVKAAETKVIEAIKKKLYEKPKTKKTRKRGKHK
jgi:hypothetical protein